jgi:hypothetical protein
MTTPKRTTIKKTQGMRDCGELYIRLQKPARKFSEGLKAILECSHTESPHPLEYTWDWNDPKHIQKMLNKLDKGLEQVEMLKNALNECGDIRMRLTERANELQALKKELEG